MSGAQKAKENVVKNVVISGAFRQGLNGISGVNDNASRLSGLECDLSAPAGSARRHGGGL
jgi:hypothetical protein